MKRWNGWGDVNTAYPLPAAGAAYLSEKLGQGHPQPDATFEQIVARVPTSRLPENSLLTADPVERLRHARGQSLPDWIALRSGQIDTFPDGIAYPNSGQEVRALMGFARDTGACLIAYGGGTSVAGSPSSPLTWRVSMNWLIWTRQAT
jgi:alkyldihydroxyacetonephosphate synthase